MEPFTDPKTLFHSKRANIFYLEKCRVMVRAGRVVYMTHGKEGQSSFNIPALNTTVVLLGIDTSITQSAVRMLALEGVLIGFSGSAGTPLFAGTSVEWLCPQNEYRPTDYLQRWLTCWFDETKRTEMARKLQRFRLHYIERVWSEDKALQQAGFYLDDVLTEKALKDFAQKIAVCENATQLLALDTSLTKQLYTIAATCTKREDFVRDEDSLDDVNLFLNQGNYLAYGLAATTLWVLGIPHGFPLMHTSTKRGALVFDVADLIKEALILPLAFICAKAQMSELAFRQHCLEAFTRHNALDFMFETLKKISGEGEEL